VVRNLSAEESHIQTYNFVRATLKFFNTSKLTHFVSLQNESLSHKTLEVLLKTAKNRTKGAWGPYAALRTTVENQWHSYFCGLCAFAWYRHHRQ